MTKSNTIAIETRIVYPRKKEHNENISSRTKSTAHPIKTLTTEVRLLIYKAFYYFRILFNLESLLLSSSS